MKIIIFLLLFSCGSVSDKLSDCINDISSFTGENDVLYAVAFVEDKVALMQNALKEAKKHENSPIELPFSRKWLEIRINAAKKIRDDFLVLIDRNNAVTFEPVIQIYLEEWHRKITDAEEEYNYLFTKPTMY